MADVGIKSFAAGNRQENRAQDNETSAAVTAEKLDCLERIDRPQHFWHPGDLVDPEKCDDEEPQERYRPEDATNSSRASGLKNKKPDQNPNRNRHDIRIEERRSDVQTLDGAQNRYRRCDHPVGVKERRPKQ